MKQRKSRRNLNNSSSRRKNNTLDLVDRISALPDSILGLILSHLPTKNAVATTILSKRWKFVWMAVHNLDFCYEDCTEEEAEDEDMKFARFVNHVLLLHDGGLLNKFRLVWKPRFIPSQVSSWISTAITRNVHDLFVSVENPYGHPCERLFKCKPLEMPISVFSCALLQSLELNGSISVSAAIVVCLPRLESLKLVSVYFQSEKTFEKLICGCPMLNYLRLDMDLEKMSYCFPPADDDFTYLISSTSLRRLEVCAQNSDFFCYCSLALWASSLEYLKLVGCIPEVFVQESLSSLVEADVRISSCEDKNTEDIYDSLVEAVCAFDCAKALTLSADAMWDSIYIDEYDHDHLNWTAPVEVPRCLSNRLKEVSFKGFACFDDECEMIGYMLKHGRVLEVMQVTCSEYNRKGLNFGLVKEICRFPRKSPACKVEFIG